MSRAARLLSTLIALLLAVPAAAQDGPALRGRVVTADGTSASGMRVIVRWQTSGDSVSSADSTTVIASDGSMTMDSTSDDSMPVDSTSADSAVADSTSAAADSMTVDSVAADSTIVIRDPTERVRRGGGGMAWGVVDSAGRYRVPLPARLPDSVTVIVDGAEGAPRTHHPALARLARAETAWEHGFVLAPREWTIPAGTYAGQRVAISPVRARRPACPECANGFRIRMAGTRSPAGFQGWPSSRFPLRVAFERGASEPMGAVPDSAAFWRAAAGVESALGMDVFRPVAYGQTLPRRLEEDPDDIVLVRIDRALSTPGLTTMVGSRGNVEYAGVALQRAGSALAAGGSELVQHELMHALGLGHTCAWRSVLAETSRCPALRAPTLTPEDVAYTQLLYRVRDLQRDGSLRWGLDAAVEGERWLGREPGGIAADTAAAGRVP